MLEGETFSLSDTNVFSNQFPLRGARVFANLSSECFDDNFTYSIISCQA